MASLPLGPEQHHHHNPPPDHHYHHYHQNNVLDQTHPPPPHAVSLSAAAAAADMDTDKVLRATALSPSFSFGVFRFGETLASCLF